MKLEEPALDIQAIMDRCERVDLTSMLSSIIIIITSEYLVLEFYEELKTFAEYGTAFQRVIDAFQGENEVLVRVRGEDIDLE